MEISIVDKSCVADESVEEEPIITSSPSQSSDRKKNRSGHDKSASTRSEVDNHSLKKKNRSGAEKKSRKGHKTKSSTKTSVRRKQQTDDNQDSNALLGKSVHSALNRSILKPTTRMKTRRQSMGSISKGNATFDNRIIKDPSPGIQRNSGLVEDMTRSGHDSDSNPSETSNCEDTDIESIQSHSLSNSNLNQPSSNRSFDTLQSQKSKSQPSSTRSIKSLSTHNNRSRASSNRSLLSKDKSLNRSSHSHTGAYDGDDDGRTKSFDTDDFNSDLEDYVEVKCSADAVPLVIENVKKDDEISPETSFPNDRNSSRTKDSPRSQQRSREGKNDNRGLDSKQRKIRNPQLTQTDELGRGSNHYKLEGVYFNHKPEPKIQITNSNDSDVEEEEIQVLTKLSHSNEQEVRTRNSSKPRFRSRRRSSMGVGAEPLERARSKSREQVSTRKDSTRIRSASSEKRVKRGPSANIISPKSQEAAKTLFGSDVLSSNQDAIVEKITDLKPPTEMDNTSYEDRHSSNSSSKTEKEFSPTDTDHPSVDVQPSSNALDKDSKESMTNTENESRKKNAPSQDPEKRQRRRNSIARTTKKDRASSQPQPHPQPNLNENHGSRITGQKTETEINNTTSDSGPASGVLIKQDIANLNGAKTLENDSTKVDQQPKDLERKQRRRASMGRTMRKDRVSTPSQEAEKQSHEPNVAQLQDPNIINKNSDQKSEINMKIGNSDDMSSSNTVIKDPAAGSNPAKTDDKSKRDDIQPKELVRKQHRRGSMGRTMRKDRVSIPSHEGEKQSHEPTISKLQKDPDVSNTNNDPKFEKGNKTYDDLCLSNTTNNDATTEDNLATTDNESRTDHVQPKELVRKQRRRASMGRTMRKDRISVQSQEAEKLLHESNMKSPEDHSSSNANNDLKPEKGSKISDNLTSSNGLVNDDTNEDNSANMETESKKIDLQPKELVRKQRRRASMGRTMRKDRASTPIEDGETKNVKSAILTPNEDPIIAAKANDKKSESEIENAISDGRNSSTKDATTVEESSTNLEHGNEESNLISIDLDKKQRRRSSSGKPSRKDRTSSRISSKSGHKIPRKSTREKKNRDSSKKNDSMDEFTSEEFASDDFSSDDFMATTEEVMGYLNNDSSELVKNRRKEITSTKKIGKEKKSRRKDSSTTETDQRSNDSADNDIALQVNIGSIESPSSLPVKESITKDNEFNERFKGNVAAPSLSDLFSKDAKENKLFSSNIAPSLCSIESEEKDDEKDNYLQLTFVAENGVGTDNLFALMDEQLNKSFNQSFSNDMDASNAESGDRNTSIRSFVSFTNEIELKVSTTSYSLPRNGVDGDDPADEPFHCNHDIFGNDAEEAIRMKMKQSLTPTPRRKKLSSPSFGLSRSLHAVPFGDGGGVNSFGEESNKAPKRGMLRKMRKGITEGSKLTFQKAASTRHLIGQATTKALARRKEEGRGLLRNDSD